MEVLAEIKSKGIILRSREQEVEEGESVRDTLSRKF